jgi:hypothetical protein
MENTVLLHVPTILIRVVVPSDIPLYYFGVDNTTTFITPTIVSDKPAAKIARFVEIKDSVEWKASKPEKPAVVMIDPNIIGLSDPNLEVK